MDVAVLLLERFLSTCRSMQSYNCETPVTPQPPPETTRGVYSRSTGLQYQLCEYSCCTKGWEISQLCSSRLSSPDQNEEMIGKCPPTAGSSCSLDRQLPRKRGDDINLHNFHRDFGTEEPQKPENFECTDSCILICKSVHSFYL